MTRKNLIPALVATALIIGALVGLFLVSERVHGDASARCERAYVTTGSVTVGCLAYLSDAEEAGRISGVAEAMFD